MKRCGMQALRASCRDCEVSPHVLVLQMTSADYDWLSPGGKRLLVWPRTEVANNMDNMEANNKVAKLQPNNKLPPPSNNKLPPSTGHGLSPTQRQAPVDGCKRPHPKTLDTHT